MKSLSQLTIALLACAAWVAPAQADESLLLAKADSVEVAAALTTSGSSQLASGNAAYARGDYDTAFRAYRNIAVLGVAEAHFKLGVMCREGQGTKKSAKQAEYWLKLAVLAKYPGASEALTSLRQSEAQG
jgi:TPR repeat protein